MLMRQTWCITVLSSCMIELNSAHKKMCRIYWVCLRKKFADLIFSQLDNYFVDLFTNFSSLVDHFYQLFWFWWRFWLVWTFCWPWLLSPVTCAEIPLRAENFTALMRRVQHKPYYARCPQILGAIMLPCQTYSACVFFPVWWVEGISWVAHKYGQFKIATTLKQGEKIWWSVVVMWKILAQ